MKASLFFKDDTSDKEYHAEVVSVGAGFGVKVSYGRRGSALQEGMKTTGAVSKDEALKVFNKVVNEKMNKGYVVEGVGLQPAQQQSSGKSSGGKKFSPMLCEKIGVDEAEQLVASGGWIVEQKVDGVRGYVMGGKLFDRRNVDITARFPEFTGLSGIKETLDGEIVCASGEFGDVASRMHLRDKFLLGLAVKKNPARFVVFDVVSDKILSERKADLLLLKESGVLPSWVMPVRSFGGEKFAEMWREVEVNGWEGLVLKESDSKYEYKRSSSWKKCKAFLEKTATFVKYEDHPRGITITTADGRRVVVNGALAPIVKHKIIKDGKVDCEIQYMPSAMSGSVAWRFPSFVRVAGDER
jgi:ATP-dependent DNA ligase